MQFSSAFAVSASGATKGSLSPVEKVSDSDMAALNAQGIAKTVRQRQLMRAINAKILGPSASPVLTGLSQLRPKHQLRHLQHPSLTTLSTVSDYVVGLSLIPETTELMELHAAVNVLTPLSHFDIISSVVIGARVAALAPLQQYSLWDQLVLDPRAGLQSLASLAVRPSVFVDRRATILTPLADFAFQDAQEAIEYVTLADAESSFTKTKLYLRDYRGTLRTQAFYDDNIFSSSSNPKGSFVMLNDLVGSVALQRGRSDLTLSYTLRDGRYADSPEDNYTDGHFNLRFDQKFAKTQSLSISADQQTAHEARGTGVSEGQNAVGVDEPLEVQRDKVVVTHHYGQTDSVLRLENTLSYNSIDYAAFPELTDEREYSQLAFNNVTKYRLGARTALSLGASLSEIDYRVDPAPAAGSLDSLDSTTKTLLAGFERDVGRSSLGRVSFGAIDRAFVDDDRESTSSAYWDAEFVWKPRSYSSVSVGMGRKFLESQGIGDFIDSREHKIAWAHAWAKRLSTQINVQYTDDNYIGSGRQDQRVDLGLRISYKFNSRLSLVGGGRYHELQSEGTDLDFKRNVIFIESNIRL